LRAPTSACSRSTGPLAGDPSITHVDWGLPGQGLAVLVVEPSPEVFEFQANVLAAIAPFVESNGTAAAFVTDAEEPDISQSTLDWVEGFVPAQIGPGRYVAHITLGFGTLEELEMIEAEPFDAFPVHPTRIAVYHLGNNGSARAELKAWALPV
jgi:hypothetical protein